MNALSSLALLISAATATAQWDPSFNGNGCHALNLGANETITALTVDPAGAVFAAGTTTSGPAIVLWKLQADGTLDTGFGPGGHVTVGMADSYVLSVRDVLRLNDGRILIAGQNTVLPNNRPFLCAFLPNGALDLGFGLNGFAQIPPAANIDFRYGSTTLQTDGSILLAGTTPVAFVDQGMVLRYSTTGVIDDGFGTGGVFTYATNVNEGFAHARQLADGRILCGGYRWSSGGSSGPRWLMLNANGAPDNTWGTAGVVAPATTVNHGILWSATNASGELLALLGTTTTSSPARWLMKCAADGSIVSSFGTNGAFAFQSAGASRMAVDTQGRMIVGGGDGSGGHYIIRFLPTGALDTSFGSNGYSTVYFWEVLTGIQLPRILAIATDAANRILIGGEHNQASLTNAHVGRRVSGSTTAVEHLEDNALRVFPNPASTELVIAGLAHHSNTVAVRFTDMAGRGFNVPPFRTGDRILVPVADIPPGVYAMEVVDATGRTARTRLVVAR